MTTMTERKSHVVWLDDEDATTCGLLGGKFGSLAEMTAAEFHVPPGFGVTTTAYRTFMEASGLADQVQAARELAATAELPEIEAAGERLAEAIQAAPMPAEVEDAIRTAYARWGSDVPVAVRSSGESEDLEGASFAGQYDTFLWIMGADEVLAHVRRCWAGLFGPQVLTYNPGGQSAALDDLAMCVGVQRMVDARAAGVMFTLDPVTGDRSKIVIEGCWGLGEGVVKGDITPDRFRVDKVTLEILQSEIAEKAQEYRFDGAGAVDLLPVEAERAGLPCLSDEHVVELATLAKRIERHRGAPQDIEWAVDRDGTVHVLQVRPETIWAGKQANRPAATTAAKGGAVAHVLGFMSGKGS